MIYDSEDTAMVGREALVTAVAGDGGNAARVETDCLQVEACFVEQCKVTSLEG